MVLHWHVNIDRSEESKHVEEVCEIMWTLMLRNNVTIKNSTKCYYVTISMVTVRLPACAPVWLGQVTSNWQPNVAGPADQTMGTMGNCPGSDHSSHSIAHNQPNSRWHHPTQNIGSFYNTHRNSKVNVQMQKSTVHKENSSNWIIKT